MLKRKQQLNYRRCQTWRSCDDCVSFVENFKIVGIGGQDLGESPRCKVIGLEPGRMYRVSKNNLCDAHKSNFVPPAWINKP